MEKKAAATEKTTASSHLRESRKLQPIASHQKAAMGRSADVEGRCRKHPEHRQSRGVCPFCLRDRLSQLSASSSTATTLANSSAGASVSSSVSRSNLSSAATSPRGLAPHNSSRLLKPGAAEGALKKSRSLAFAVARPKEKKKKGGAGGESKEKEKRKKAGGFWSKLVMGSERRSEAEDGVGTLRSRTMKEKSSAKWTLF